MYYIPRHEPLPERRGHNFLPLVVGGWQVDHGPSGFCVWPQGTAKPISYRTARRIAATLRHHPMFRMGNFALYFDENGRSRCPQITKALKAQIMQLVANNA